MKKLIIFFVVVTLLMGCGGEKDQQARQSLDNLSWEEVRAQARGQTVNMMMWQGDPSINAYMNQYVVPSLKEQFGITLNISGGQGSAIVNTLMNEMQAGKAESELDLMWINGETFFQLSEISALYGPFVDQLPNAQYINFDNPFIHTDFQQKVEGMECPWGNVQMCLIYDAAHVKNPPRTMSALEQYVKAHPGVFTIPNDFTGMTLLKGFLIELSGSQDGLNGAFDEEKYKNLSSQLWKYLNRIKPYFWKQGETFPAERAQMNQMFANGELYFTMGNNDAQVENKVLKGLFPTTARAYVMDMGSIQNSHFLGIPKHSAHPAAALVVCNFMISPEAQLRKMNPEVWGDYTILSIKKLPEEWQQKFAALPPRKYALQREKLQDKALMEPAPEYMIRLYDDFRTYVIEQ